MLRITWCHFSTIDLISFLSWVVLHIFIDKTLTVQEIAMHMCPFEVDPFAWPKITMHLCPFEMDPFAWPRITMHMCPFEVDPFVWPEIAMRKCPDQDA